MTKRPSPTKRLADQVLALQKLSDHQQEMLVQMSEQAHDAETKLRKERERHENATVIARARTERLKVLLLQAHRRIARLEGRLDIVGPDSTNSHDVDVPATDAAGEYREDHSWVNS